MEITQRNCSLKEYFKLEQNAVHRHEFHNGNTVFKITSIPIDNQVLLFTINTVHSVSESIF